MPEIEPKYKSETPADELLERLRRLSACAEAMEHYNKFGGGTVNEMVEGTLDQSWAAWYLSVLGKANETKLRKVMISRIKDPMMAFSLYLKLAWLTDEEDKLLEDKFNGKLPTAEKELVDGKVTRTRVVG